MGGHHKDGNTDPEKNAGLNNPSSSSSLSASQAHSTTPAVHPSHLGSHVSHAKERFRHFLHPDGSRIHVALSPEEAITLRRTLSTVREDEKFEVYLSGSKEHLDALRKAHAHHKLRKEELRGQHPDAFEVFESVHGELDLISHELERVTTQGVTLEAHFTKFGYNAKIRSYDDEESPVRSGATTPKSGQRSPSVGTRQSTDTNSRISGSSVERGFATTLKLWKKPVIRQYWHKGILWRASTVREIQSFELFIDLLYVGILAIIGDNAAEAPDGHSLIQFAIVFTLSWKIWSDLETTISWFETDDVAQRVSILLTLSMLFGLTTNIEGALETTYPTLIGFFLAARLFNASYLLVVASFVPMVRGTMVSMVAIVIVSSSIWIGSIYVSYPMRLAPIAVALLFDQCSHLIYSLQLLSINKLGSRARRWVSRHFEVTPAMNIEHRTERMNAFVALVFGYMVVSQLYQSARNGIDAHYGKAVLGLTQAFCFNWLYFEVDNSNLHLHAIRRSAISTFIWSTAHLPFVMGIILAAGALARLVLAHDTPNSSIPQLTPKYRVLSEEHIASGIRWFYCAGLGVALFSMGLISLSHEHLHSDTLRVPKQLRMTGRFAVAIVLLCLPLVTGLDSLGLVGTVTALIVFVLCLELWANSCCKESLCSRDQPCQYFGRCHKKDLERLVRDGDEKVDVDAVLRKARPSASVGLCSI